MSEKSPILVALPLDHETQDVIGAATELALRIEAPLLAVHALTHYPAEPDSHVEKRIGEARDALLAHLAPAQDRGVLVVEPVIRRGRAASVVLEVAAQVNAHLIVTGGGGPATVRRWVLGSVAEQIVRGAGVPVFMARGTLPGPDRPILCPVDLSPQSRVGFNVGLRMARLFGAPLTVLTVIDTQERGRVGSAELEREVAREEEKSAEQVRTFLAAHDLEGVEVDHKVVVGKPSTRIVEEAEDVGLVALGSRGFDLLIPGALGTVTERTLRFSRSSAITVRDLDPAREDREMDLQRLAELKSRADELLAADKPDEALPLLQLAAARAPANAALQESLAAALSAVGREEEASSRRHLAGIIRASFS